MSDQLVRGEKNDTKIHCQGALIQTNNPKNVNINLPSLFIAIGKPDKFCVALG